MTTLALSARSAIAVVVAVSCIACSPATDTERRLAAGTRLSLSEVERLLAPVLASARGKDTGDECVAESSFDRESYVSPLLRKATLGDIAHFDQPSWNGESNVVEIVLKTDRWPDFGLAVFVKVKGNHCQSYSLSSARAAEGSEGHVKPEQPEN